MEVSERGYRGAGEVKVPKRDDLLESLALWSSRKERRGGKSGGGQKGRQEGRKGQQLVGGASVFLFLAIIIQYKIPKISVG